MPMTPKQMEKFLLKNGFIFERQKGSHRTLNQKKRYRSHTLKRFKKRYRAENTQGRRAEISPV